MHCIFIWRSVLSSSCELSLPQKGCASSFSCKQTTLQSSVSLSGHGLFTGQPVTLTLHPRECGHGIVFQRVDLPNRPLIPAHLDRVQSTPRCTILGAEGTSIQTVEHLLAALKGCQIDNLLIEISGAEVPIFDGSSRVFVEAIESVGILSQESEKQVLQLKTPVFWSSGDVHLVALPSSEYRISYTMHHPHSTFLRAQYASFLIDSETFKKEIAPCRTFSLYEEIAPLIEKGVIKGGGLENAVIIKEDKVVNPEGVRFSDEMVRHKILDLVGDLSLMGVSFTAHVIAIRSGHASNNAFAKEMFTHIKMENA